MWSLLIRQALYQTPEGCTTVKRARIEPLERAEHPWLNTGLAPVSASLLHASGRRNRAISYLASSMAPDRHLVNTERGFPGPDSPVATRLSETGQYQINVLAECCPV